MPIAGDIISPQDFVQAFAQITGKQVGALVVLQCPARPNWLRFAEPLAAGMVVVVVVA